MDTYEVDRPPGSPLEPFFYLTHGAGGDLSSRGLKAMSQALAGKGHLSVRTNLAYRAAGRKSPPAAEQSVAGFRQTYEKVRSKMGSGARWVAGGRSYGGRVASMAAAQGLEAAGLIFFPYPLHRPGDPSEPRVAHWPQIKVPCLFVQGTKDPFCDIGVMQALLPALGGEPTLLLVEGGDHSLKVGRDKVSGIPARTEETVVEEILDGIVEWARGL